MIAPIFALPHVPVRVEVETGKAMLAEVSKKSGKPSRAVKRLGFYAERRLKIRDLAGQGMNMIDIAQATGLTYDTVGKICRRYSIETDRSRPARGLSHTTIQRRKKMIKMFKAGASCKEMQVELLASKDVVLRMGLMLRLDIAGQDRKARNRRLLKMHADGVGTTTIAAAMDLSRSTVQNIIKASK